MSDSVFKIINRRFTSANSVDVDRASIKADEWQEVCNYVEQIEARVAELERSEAHCWWKLGMANARRLIKANKSTSNASLFMNLFGTGFSTARARCVEIGLDPESNESSLNVMAQRLRQQADESENG